MISREIGSWFWDVPILEKENQFFRGDIKWLGSGRQGLRAIAVELRNKGIKSITLPSWCCETMITPFQSNGIAVTFYPVIIDKQGCLCQDMLHVDTQALLIMDYFGFQAGEACVPIDYHGIVIRDTTHRPFTGGYNDASYYVGSLRKWAGFWTGGYVVGQLPYRFEDMQYDIDYVENCKCAMELKQNYMEGNNNSKEEYLRLFEIAENCLDSMSIYRATLRDVELAKHFNVDLIFHRRRKNAQVLIDGLKEFCMFKQIEGIDCPLFVPIIVTDGKRDALRRYLIEQEIYCPVHWPISEHHVLSDDERFVYDNELSLVCDQRYNEDDMQRMVVAVRRFFEQC